MTIELRNEETGNVKKINHGINWFLLITSPIFGITLFKNKLNRSGFIMLTASLLFFLGIICFSIFSSSFASMYPYGTSQVQAYPSFMMQVYYLLDIDYKDAKLLRQFITERGKIMPRRLTGTCAKHQRNLAAAIKTARIIALVPFTLNK